MGLLKYKNVARQIQIRTIIELGIMLEYLISHNKATAIVNASVINTKITISRPVSSVRTRAGHNLNQNDDKL